MFQNIGNFFRKTTQQPEISSAPPIPQEDRFLINMFSQNLAAFSTISRDASCGPLFSRLVGQFATTFRGIKSDHLKDEEIKLIFIKYCQTCSELGISLIHEKQNLTEALLNSLTIISSLFGNLPHAELFFPFFCAVVQEIKKNPSFFEISKPFLTALFKSNSFFPEFMTNDGFSLVFSSFFLQENIDSLQEVFLQLVFKTVPMDIYKSKMKSKIRNLKTFIELLTPQLNASFSLKNACLFLSYYIIAFLQTRKNAIIDKFQSYGGFSLLNKLFILNCPEIAHECYEILMIETNINSVVFLSIYDLFMNEETSVELRSSLVQLLAVQTNNVNTTYKNITSVAPLSNFLKRPPLLYKESLDTLAVIIINFVNKGFQPIDSDLVKGIFNLINFPEDDNIPVDPYLELLYSSLKSEKLSADLLIDENFLSFFLFNPSPQEIASYYDNHSLILQIISIIFKSEKSQKDRNKIILKLLDALEFIKNTVVFFRFATNLLENSFTSDIFHIFLSSIHLKYSLLLLIKLTKRHSESFRFFQENNGFEVLDKYINSNPEMPAESNEKNNVTYLYILKFLSSLSYFKQHPEIDTWINQQPFNSKLYDCQKKSLSQIAMISGSNNYMLHMPSLLPFAPEFNINSPYNLYLAGKFGIPAYKKIGVSIKEIPHIYEIANRYILPEFLELLLDNNNLNIASLINSQMPQFSIFEFVPSAKPAFIVYKQHFSAISFWFCFSQNSKTQFTLLNCQIIKLELQEDILTISTNRDKINHTLDQSKISESHPSKWHNIVIVFHMRRNIAYKCEVVIDNIHIGFLKIDIQAIPSIAIFGNEKSPIPVPLLISSNIIFSDSMLNEEQISNSYFLGPSSSINKNKCIYNKSSSVFFVKYLGFASYFRSSIQIEKLFCILEKSNSLDKFISVFKTLINLQLIHHLKFTKFWSRMTLSFCRQKDLIEEELHYIICDIACSFYGSDNTFSKALFEFLSDSEIYFVFSILAIKQLLNKILENPNVNWQFLDDSNLTSYLMTSLRSGIDEKLKLSFVPIISKLIQVKPNPDKLKYFFNSIFSLCDWTFDSIDLLREPVPNSVIQHRLIFAFVSAAKLIPDIELYNMNQILTFMMLFLDDRAICLSELIALYSYKNLKYVTSTPLLKYIFSSLSGSIKTWIVALSILSGSPPQTNLIKNFQIRRPAFMSTILEMLNSLAANCAYSALESKSGNTKLFGKIVHVLSSLDKTQYNFFTQQQCIPILHSLLFLGICPNTYISDSSTNERSVKIWSTFSLQPPSKTDIKGIVSLTTPSSLFQPFVPDNLCYDAKSISSESILYFPDDISSFEECSVLFDIVKSSCLLSLFTTVILDGENLLNTLLEFIGGTSLMYTAYFNWIVKELILEILNKISAQPQISIFKSVFQGVYRASTLGMFNSEVYLTIMDSVFQHLSYFTESVIDNNLFSDDKFLKMYKDFLLASFVFIPEEESEKIFKLLAQYHQYVFKGTIFNDNKYSSLWLHVTRPRGGNSPERIQCMTSFMQIIDNTSVMGSYLPTEVQSEWVSFKKKPGILSEVTLNSLDELKIQRMNNIIEAKQKCYTSAAKAEILSRIFRCANFSIEQNIVSYRINLNQRKNERLIFEFSLLNRKMQMQSDFVPSSYHLSPLSFPVTQSRALSPSLFKIRSPHPSKRVSKSFFKLLSEEETNNLIKHQRIKAIEQRGLMNCSPEWCLFNNLFSSFDKEDLENIKNDNNQTEVQSNENNAFEKHSYKEGLNNEEGINNEEEDNNENEMNTNSLENAATKNDNTNNDLHSNNDNLFSNKPFTSPFEYSAVIEQGPQPMLKLFESSFSEYGPLGSPIDVNFFYFIHPLPSVMFITPNVMLLIVLAKGSLQLISHPQNPVAFLPFTESVALGEFSQVSLFCGHVVLIIRLEKIVRMQRHFYIHRKVGLCISPIGSSDIILLFSSNHEMTSAAKLLSKKLPNLRRSFPPNHLLFSLRNVQSAQILWQNNSISNFDYLLLLNTFGGRSFADLSQYPIIPWIASPATLQERNLSLPMGQLSESRAKHFDQTFELTNPPYFYGFHYSLPGAVFWLLMRLPPFTFFQWDLNNGWDNSQRLFASISDAWNSAAVTNPSDLKELIPAIYQTPESLTNISHLDLSITDNVILPDWAMNNPNFLSENMMRLLNESEHVQAWIDLIFGVKQTGDAAIEAKNLFLPSSYHKCKNSDLDMDEEAFKNQVLNFGQCPIQLFTKSHMSKQYKGIKDWKEITFETYEMKVIQKTEQQTKSLPSENSKSSDQISPITDTNKSPISSRSSPLQQIFQFSFSNLTKELTSHADESSLTKDATNKISTNSSNLNIKEYKVLMNQNIISYYNFNYRKSPKCRDNRFKVVHFSENNYFAIPIMAIALPFKCYNSLFYFISDTENESFSLIEAESGKAVFVRYSYDFSHIKDASISNDGLFLAISFEFGRVDVFQVVYEKGKPFDLNRFSSFYEKTPCITSAILSQDYLCASVFSKKIILWNFATQMRHRTIDLDTIPLQISFDSFNGVLSVLLQRSIVQYSINAQKLREMTFQTDCLCMATIGLDFTFDKRLTIICHENGNISLIAVSKSNYDFILVKSLTQIHTNKIVSVFPIETSPRFVTVDDHGCAKITIINAIDPRSNIFKCSFCENPRTALCSQCQTPLCDSCKFNGSDICQNCSQNSDLLNFAPFQL